MTSITFYRLALFLPYLTLIPGYYLARDYFVNLSPSGIFSAQFLGLSSIVITGFWLIPYTIFVTGLLIWSRGKSSNTVRSWFLRSPFILMMIAPIIFMIIGALTAYSSGPDMQGNLAAVTLIGIICSVPLSLIIGFIFIVLALLLYEILNKLGYIRDENESQEDMTTD